MVRMNAAAQKPFIAGNCESQAYAATYDGIARGSETSTSHMPRSGTFVRATSHAVGIPMRRQAETTTTTSPTEVVTVSRVRGRMSTSMIRCRPASPTRTTR